MPHIAEIKEIDGEAWVRIGKPGEFPSGTAIWTPEEVEAFGKLERERCARIAEDQIAIFSSDEYALGQPMSTTGERYACAHLASLIRNLT